MWKNIWSKAKPETSQEEKYQKEQADLSVNSNHSDGDRNGNATVQIQDALGDALNVDMIIVTK